MLFQWLAKNIGTRLIAIVVAIVLWFVVLGSRSVEVTKDVALDVVTSDEMTVANDIPDRIVFRLSGPKAFLRAILNRPESPIKVNLVGNTNPTVTYRFFSDNIRVPPGVKVLGVSPPAIQIRQEAVRTKDVPVRVDLRGASPEGYRIVKVKVEPSVVKVRAAKSRLQGLNDIPTIPVDVSELRASQTQVVPLDGLSAQIKVDGAPVRVTIEIASELMRYRVKGVPVKVLADHKSKLKEATVHLVVMANFDQLKLLSSEVPTVEADLRGKPKGTYEVPLKVTLPKGVSFVRAVPRSVHVTLY